MRNFANICLLGFCGCAFILALGVISVPVPALKELPSITYDSLASYNEKNGEKDSEGSESGQSQSYVTAAGNVLRNLIRSATPEEPSSVFYYLSPTRLVRSVVSGIQSTGKTFSTEFSKRYRALTSEMKERVIPEAANLLGVWTVPPKNVLDDMTWLDGA